MTAHIAYLGTGRLGAGFVEAALERGDTVAVWNRSPDKAQALAAFGARVAATPADAVQGAERVHLVLKDDESVESVVAEFRGAMAAGAIIVDHTTTLPTLTAARAVRLNAAGVRYIHCPVFIGPAMARKGLGIILAAGPKALFDAIHPALAVQAAKVEYLGERPDAAAVYKLCGNAYLLGLGGVIADVLTVATSAGMAATDAMKLFDFFDASAIVRGRGKSMAAGDFSPSFELTMARKDVRLMIETAGEKPLAALPGIAARMDALIEAGHGGDDFGVLAIDVGR